jgi:hypothetical protein
VIAAKIVTEETWRLEMPLHSKVAHMFLNCLDKFHPPSEIARQPDFWEIDYFMVRHGLGSFLVSFNNDQNRAQFSAALVTKLRNHPALSVFHPSNIAI